MMRLLVCVAILAAVHAAPGTQHEVKRKILESDLTGEAVRDELELKKEEPLPELMEEEKVDAALRAGGIRAEPEREKVELEPEPSRREPRPEPASEPHDGPIELPESELEEQMVVVMIAMFGDEDLLPPQTRQERRLRNSFVTTSTVPGGSRQVFLAEEHDLEPGEMAEKTQNYMRRRRDSMRRRAQTAVLLADK